MFGRSRAQTVKTGYNDPLGHDSYYTVRNFRRDGLRSFLGNEELRILVLEILLDDEYRDSIRKIVTDFPRHFAASRKKRGWDAGPNNLAACDDMLDKIKEVQPRELTWLLNNVADEVGL